MSKTSNLPPGVTVSDIPDNRPTDVEWATLFATISAETEMYDIHPTDALMLWRVGLLVWLRRGRK